MMARRTTIAGRLTVLWLVCCVACPPGLQARQPDPDAFVYILNMGIRDNKIVFNGLRVGFAVGDGRLILTAAHCLEDFENAGHSLFEPLVISPYHGDVFEAHVIDSNERDDIAVLRPRWDSHPGLTIETGDRWKRARKIVVAGYQPSDLSLGGSTKVSRRISLHEETVARASGKGRHAIQLGSVGYPGKGWSGSAFVLPDTGTVVGVLSNERYVRRLFRKKHYIFGCNAEAIREFLQKNAAPLTASESILPERSGTGNFDLILRLFDSILVEDVEDSRKIVKELCQARPDSYVLHILAGWMLNAPRAEEYFTRAIDLAPDRPFAHVAYANYLLHHDRADEALSQFQSAVAGAPNHVFAHTGRIVALTQTDPREAGNQARELTARWPSNGGFWFELSRTLRKQRKYEQELPILRKAIELPHPDRLQHLYQRHLADSLAHNKKYSEAEQAYKTTLKEHPCARCWSAYTWLLIRMGADRAEDARRALEKAKALNEDDSLPRATIRKYENAIRRMTRPENPGQ